jgi:predicted DNA-binding transcriptional regulator AlpA
MCSRTDLAIGRALTRDQVLAYLSISRSTFDRLRRRPDFPAPRRIGVGCVRWLERELAQWAAAQPAVSSRTSKPEAR